jgi:hypothetical protein
LVWLRDRGFRPLQGPTAETGAALHAFSRFPRRVGTTAAARQLRADPALDPLQREASIQALLRLTGGLPLAVGLDGR